METLSDLMKIKNEIRGLELEIEEILKKTNIQDLEYKLSLLRKMYQGALDECVRNGRTSEGTYKIVNKGRVTRKINIESIKDDSRFTPYLTCSIKDAQWVLKDDPNGDEVLDSICTKVQGNKYEVIDLDGE